VSQPSQRVAVAPRQGRLGAPENPPAVV